MNLLSKSLIQLKLAFFAACSNSDVPEFHNRIALELSKTSSSWRFAEWLTRLEEPGLKANIRNQKLLDSAKKSSATPSDLVRIAGEQNHHE